MKLQTAWADGSIVGMWVEIQGERTRVINKLTTVAGGIMVNPPVARKRIWHIQDISPEAVVLNVVEEGK